MAERREGRRVGRDHSSSSAAAPGAARSKSLLRTQYQPAESVITECTRVPGRVSERKQMTDRTSAADWRKATRSNSNNNCVEIALLPNGGAAVRDTKHNGAGPILQFTGPEWEAFIGGVKDGEFDPA